MLEGEARNVLADEQERAMEREVRELCAGGDTRHGDARGLRSIRSGATGDAGRAAANCVS